MKRILVLLIVTPLIFSCTKSNTGASGKVTDQCTGAPIGNALVEIYIGDKNSYSHRAFKDSMRTYSDGSYEFAFRSFITDNNYWVQCNGIKSEYIYKKQKKEINFQIPDNSQSSNLYLSSKNISPFDNNDSIYIDFVCPYSYSPTYHQQLIYTGATVDTTNGIIVNGCSTKLVNLSWAVTKNHITTNFTNTVTCTNGGTSTFQINY